MSCSKKVIYPAPPSLTSDYVSTLSLEKQTAYQFVTSRRDQRILDALLSDDFYSRDRSWKGEKEAFIKKRMEDTSFTVIRPVRILQDDSLVAVHSRMLGDTLRFRWDIIRVEDKEIYEHWSNVHDSIGHNPSGHSEIDGPTLPTQLEKTDTNRALIARFIDQCLIREDGGAPNFFNFSLYVQHNRNVGDGIKGLVFEIIKMKLRGGSLKFEDNYHVIAEGNFVLSASEGFVDGNKVAFYDLFRIQQSRIVEHWDIIAPIDAFLNYDPPIEKKK